MQTNRRDFLRQLGLGVLGSGLLSTLPLHTTAAPIRAGLTRSTPSAEGVSASQLMRFFDAIDQSKIEFHSVMVLRHGKVVAEGWWNPYRAELPHTLYSLSKSFTSTAVGLAIQEGRLTLDSPVISFFPDQLPANPGKNLQAMQVRHLLTMSTGHAKDTIPDLRNSGLNNWPKLFLQLPVEHEPGTKFLYNTGATYMLSAIVQKTTGQTVAQYLTPRLFEPLGIEGWDWEADPDGVTVGGYGLRVKTEDIARFGQLYLQKGKWLGKQLIPASWVEAATSAQISNAPANPTAPLDDNDWAQGYGFQFWRCTRGAFRGDGAFGQFCLMLPEQDAVVAITAESFDLQGSLRLVWNHLLPAFDGPVDEADDERLRARTSALQLVPPPSSGNTPVPWTDKKWALESNTLGAEFFSLKLNGTSGSFSLKNKSAVYQVEFGMGHWKINPSFRTQQLFPLLRAPVVTTPLAASATWKDDKTLVITLRYAATAHGDELTITVDPNLKIQLLNSVSKGNPASAEQRPVLVGRS